MAQNASTMLARSLAGQTAAVADIATAREAKDARPVASARPEVSDLYLEHLKSISAAFGDQLKVADQKAAYVFSFLVAMMILSEQVRTRISQLLDPALSMDWALSLVLGGSLSTAALAAILVVVPRFVQSDTPLYWGAWPEAGARLEAEQFLFDKRRMADAYRRQAETLAKLCRKKYRLVRCSYECLLIGLATYVVATAIR
jgi:hypothetical protein